MTRLFAQLCVRGVEPAPQGSKRYVGGNRASGGRFIEASKKLEPFRSQIGTAVKDYFLETGDDAIFTVPVEVHATFILPRPKTVKRIWPSVMPDLDKLQRALGDAISLERYGQLLADDALIVQWHSEKVYGSLEEMGVCFTIEPAKAPWSETPIENLSDTLKK